MSANSSIEWTDATWNPVTGCTEVSPGCDHCYAKTFAERWRGIPGHHFERGFDVQLRPERLAEPYRWRKPKRVFVNSMSDLFHKDVPDDFIVKVFEVMASTVFCPHGRTYQVLTKRPDLDCPFTDGRYVGDERFMDICMTFGSTIYLDDYSSPEWYARPSVESRYAELRRAIEEQIPENVGHFLRFLDWLRDHKHHWIEGSH